MPTRYAVIRKQDDGSEVVSDIKLMEGIPPEIRSDQKNRVTVEKAEDGVMIGMVRGGKRDAVGGFGFAKQGTQTAADRGLGVTKSDSAFGAAQPDSNPDDKVRYASDGSLPESEQRVDRASFEPSEADEGSAATKAARKGKAA